VKVEEGAKPKRLLLFEYWERLGEKNEEVVLG